MPKINLIVDEDCAGERVDLFLAENTLLSRSWTNGSVLRMSRVWKI